MIEAWYEGHIDKPVIVTTGEDLGRVLDDVVAAGALQMAQLITDGDTNKPHLFVGLNGDRGTLRYAAPSVPTSYSKNNRYAVPSPGVGRHHVLLRTRGLRVPRRRGDPRHGREGSGSRVSDHRWADANRRRVDQRAGLAMIDPRPLDFDDQWNVRERDPQWTVDMPADAAGWSAVLGKNAVRLTREADDVTARSTRAVSLPDAVLPSLLAALRAVQNTEACRTDDGEPTGSWTHIFDADRTELYGTLYVLDRRSVSEGVSENWVGRLAW